VAEYFTELPSKQFLIDKLNEAIKAAKSLMLQEPLDYDKKNFTR